MAFEVRMTGTADLYSLRRALKQVGGTGLSRQMNNAFKVALKPLEAEIRGEATHLMPSGYGAILSRSLTFRLASRTAKQSTSMKLRVFGDGKRERRDVPSLNRGRLRHPVFGRRRQAWVNQRVRPGFIDKPVDRLVPSIQREMNAVIDEVAAKIVGK